MTARLLSLTDIQEFCARHSGRTTELVNVSVDHLLSGKGILLIVAHDMEKLRYLMHSIMDEKSKHGYSFDIDRYQQSIYHVDAALQFTTPSNLENYYYNYKCIDVLFDTPELDVFNTPMLQNIPVFFKPPQSADYITFTYGIYPEKLSILNNK